VKPSSVEPTTTLQDASSALPRTTQQAQPSSVEPTTTPKAPLSPRAQRALTSSQQELMKKMEKKQKDKTYVEDSQWHPANNVYDTANDARYKKNEEAFGKKWRKVKKKKNKKNREEKIKRIQGVVNDNPVKIEESEEVTESEESTDYEVEPTEEE
jgi:hypothetical protein